MTPRVSVIIPCYNGERFLRAALDSALAQTMGDVEVLLIDDGSIDSTREVVDSIADERLHYLWQPNTGPAAARDRGFRAARGEYLAFLDADDVWLPTMLERCIAILDSAPRQVGAVTTDYRFIGPDGQMLERASAWKPWRGDVFERLLREIPFVGPGIMWRRECFESINGFDMTPEINDDWVNWLRIARGGVHFEAIEEPLVLIRRHDGNITRTQAWRVIQWQLNALDAIIGEWPVPESLRYRAYAAIYWAGVIQALMEGDIEKARSWWTRAVLSDSTLLVRDETYYALILDGLGCSERGIAPDLEQGWERAVTFMDAAFASSAHGQRLTLGRRPVFARGLLCFARIAYAHGRSWLARKSLLRAFFYAPATVLSRSGFQWGVRIIIGNRTVRLVRHYC